MVAVMLSSFMAALSSCFNSCSALFTMDVYRPAMAERGLPASEQQLVFVGRFFTVVMGILSCVWLPMMEHSYKQLFMYIQSMQTIWGAPVAVVFVASMVTDISTASAWITLLTGLFCGVLFWMLHDVFPVRPVCDLSIMLWPIFLFIVSS